MLKEYTAIHQLFQTKKIMPPALNMDMSGIRRFLRLALPIPPIMEAIIAGKAPRTLSLTKLDTTLPWVWQAQLKLFGMA